MLYNLIIKTKTFNSTIKTFRYFIVYLSTYILFLFTTLKYKNYDLICFLTSYNNNIILNKLNYIIYFICIFKKTLCYKIYRTIMQNFIIIIIKTIYISTFFNHIMIYD